MTRQHGLESVSLIFAIFTGCSVVDQPRQDPISASLEKLWVIPPVGDPAPIDAVTTLVGGISLSQIQGPPENIFKTNDILQILIGPALIDGIFYEYKVLLAATSPGIGWVIEKDDAPVWYGESGWSFFWGYRPRFFHHWEAGGILRGSIDVTAKDNLKMAAVIDPTDANIVHVFAVDHGTAQDSVTVTLTVKESGVVTTNTVTVKEKNYRTITWKPSSSPPSFDMGTELSQPHPNTTINERFEELKKISETL
ncbi:MAG: S-type pyocin domain-containing protein [Planctomycetota bacterium]